ncbi:hypothetical protein N7456_003263 [Penicillium angulare]|uniref:Retrotransposon gag domain-containing protein n=1 Tax=Penicillium angulare TaxID=116970 RepID=A0A9W9KIH0_9EURO|nr:hypothetical protein N7456_003263 [Penicillium angulare]
MVLLQVLHAKSSNVFDYQTIFDQITYMNKEKKEAEIHLLSIKQGSDSLTGYIARFDDMLDDIRTKNLSDSEKISAFRRGVHSKVGIRLNECASLPETYQELLCIVQGLSGLPEFYEDQKYH